MKNCLYKKYSELLKEQKLLLDIIQQLEEITFTDTEYIKFKQQETDYYSKRLQHIERKIQQRFESYKIHFNTYIPLLNT